jgi:hypothetical protein
MQVNVPREREFLPLTDSLASRIRWRLCDYEAMLRAEVALLMLDNDEHDRRSEPRVERRDR